MGPFAPTWLTVAAPAAAAVGSALLYGTAWPRAQLFGPVLYRAPEDASPHRVALLVTGGVNETITPTLLDILDRRNCLAAFAVPTPHAVEMPRLLHALDDADHLIVNHGPAFRAANLFQGYGFWRHALDANDDAIFDAIGLRPRLFCPPLGCKSPVMLREALWGGHVAVTWSRHATMWLPKWIDQARTNRLAPGAILAIPGTNPRILKRLPATLDALVTSGLRFQRLDRLLGVPGYRGAMDPDA